MKLFLIQAVTFFFVAYGSYIIIVTKLKLPYYKTVKAAMEVAKIGEKTKGFDVFINEIATRISKIIPMDSYKKKRLEVCLRYANINMTPELYKATTITKTLLVLVFIIPCLFFAPVLSIPVVIVALVIYFMDEIKLNETFEKKREQIEFELPRFASTIKQEIKSSHDVLGILERYAPTAGEAFKKELEITIADMKSSNYEAALVRMEARVSLGTLSDIVRGLIGVIRGDDNGNYFQMLSHDLDLLELQRLENIAAKQPSKLKKYQFLIFACILLIYVVVIAVYAYVMIAGESRGLL